MEAVRVLLINDFVSAGGAEEVYRLSASLLREQGFAVSTLDCTDITDTSIANNKVWNIAACRAFSERAHAWRPDVVWLHNFHGFFSLAIFHTMRRLKKKLRFQTLMTLHDYQLMGFNPTLLTYDRTGRMRPLPERLVGKWSALRFRSTPKGLFVDIPRKIYWLVGRRVANASKAVDLFLCPSPFMERIAQRVGLSPSRYLPQPCFASPRTPKPPIEEGHKLRLAFLGRVGPEKGLHEFLELLIQMKFANVESLTVIGDGPELDRVKNAVRSSDVSNRVYFFGRLARETALNTLAEHDALVVPSIWYENAPMVIIEAACAGTPAFARRIGSLVDFGDSVGNKVLFDASPRGFGKGVERLTNHLRERRSSYTLTEFAVDSYAGNLEKLLVCWKG